MYAFWGQKQQGILCRTKVNCRGNYKREIPEIFSQFWHFWACLQPPKITILKDKSDLKYIY